MLEKTSYLLQTSIASHSCHCEVLRSFSDFEWLYLQLRRNNPGLVVPGLPAKNILGKLSKNLVESISGEFMMQRKQGL
jgi:hypothetical protein